MAVLLIRRAFHFAACAATANFGSFMNPMHCEVVYDCMTRLTRLWPDVEPLAAKQDARSISVSLCSAGQLGLPRHGLVAMAFLNSQAWLAIRWPRLPCLPRDSLAPVDFHSTWSQAFVAHWPGGLHRMYGTNPMASSSTRLGHQSTSTSGASGASDRHLLVLDDLLVVFRTNHSCGELCLIIES